MNHEDLKRAVDALNERGPAPFVKVLRPPFYRPWKLFVYWVYLRQQRRLVRDFAKTD